MHAAVAGPAFTGPAAKADSPDTAFSNPAGMSRLEEGGLTIQGILARGFGEFRVDDTVTSMDGGDPDNDSSPIFVPFVYCVRPVGDDWHAGISLTVPTGFGSDYRSTWAGRYYSDSYSLVYVSLTGALSRRSTAQRTRWDRFQSDPISLVAGYRADTAGPRLYERSGCRTGGRPRVQQCGTSARSSAGVAGDVGCGPGGQ